MKPAAFLIFTAVLSVLVALVAAAIDYEATLRQETITERYRANRAERKLRLANNESRRLARECARERQRANACPRPHCYEGEFDDLPRETSRAGKAQKGI